MKIKYCRIQFSNGKFKTIKDCKDLSFDETFNRSCVRVSCTDGRIYIFNWNLVQEFKLWEEEEKDEKHRKKVPSETSGDKGYRPGDPSPDGTEESSDRSDDGEGS